MSASQAQVAASLSIPWTLIGFRLWDSCTPRGTWPITRLAVYGIAAGLQALAIYGAVWGS